MNTVTELIAQWRAEQISGTALMRGLASTDQWCIPVSEEAAVAALAHDTRPSLQLSTIADGETALCVFSSGDALHAYRKAIKAKGSQHYVTVHGTWVFSLGLEGIDRLWFDPLTPNDIFYKKEQFDSLHEMAAALRVEEALAGLRKGIAPDDALQTVREYKNYYMAIATDSEGSSYILAPDSKGRSLAAIFTSDDTFEAFSPTAQEVADGGEVQQMQMDALAVFEAVQNMRVDGMVFNCKGPVTPVAFQPAFADVVLKELSAQESTVGAVR